MTKRPPPNSRHQLHRNYEARHPNKVPLVHTTLSSLHIYLIHTRCASCAALGHEAREHKLLPHQAAPQRDPADPVGHLDESVAQLHLEEAELALAAPDGLQEIEDLLFGGAGPAAPRFPQEHPGRHVRAVKGQRSDGLLHRHKDVAGEVDGHGTGYLTILA